MKMLVPQEDLPPVRKKFFLLKLFANITITSMVLLVMVADAVVWLYQEIYFSVAEIPKVKRSKYVIVTRYKLKNLTLIQKWCCGYCEYVNGVIAWVKAIANQTEIYSCAIKYSHHYPGQEYQSKFYDQEMFNRK
jgi:hypothetical protein